MYHPVETYQIFIAYTEHNQVVQVLNINSKSKYNHHQIVLF